MKYLDLTFADPARNLACDEALLEMVEARKCADGVLRIWQPKNYFVVLGHSKRRASEVDETACSTAGIPILRRISGGGTVIQGSGCLNYSMVLDSERHKIRNIMAAFRYVLERHRQLIREVIGAEVGVDGISDLTVAGRKFSGNAQYRKSRAVLVHGTFLLNFDLSMIESFLPVPAQQPKYRRNRSHRDFVTNLSVEPRRIVEGLSQCWHADETLKDLAFDRIDSLVSERYRADDWTKKF